jgi:type I restriction enzyme R subunit
VNEAETRAELIDPALRVAGWGEVPESKIQREYYITQGRLQGAGRRAKPEIADYVLIYKGQRLAVLEAKQLALGATEGLGQAKKYCSKLEVRYALSTNGQGIYQVDMKSGEEGPLASYPTPDDLWAATFGNRNEWRERFADVPFEDNGGQWQARYYQELAVNKALESIANGRERVLLTLATGTGKTFIAFQLAWKLFQSRWNISREPTRRPRILFLADRNILADQAYNAFTPFAEDARVRIAPDEIRKKGQVPKNASVFFTIFQTFMSGKDEEGNPAPYFGDYPPDFFDFIIIDECHRGGANDEGTWRGILEYFKPAVQLGLTATPKRKINADTYAYFGEPVYTYSLKDGINDGFLTPFKVQQIATTMDDYIYTPDDEVVQGQPEQGKRYTESEFNRTIIIPEREMKRVRIFMGMIDQSEKTIVFCANQAHAAVVRDLINQVRTSKNPDYCARVTANDGADGELSLKRFQDNEKTIPTILTTSQKLSTGVDARNVRNIVLMRPVNSMIEFKQIIGRGTRLYEGKDYFTIYDFVRAYEHFNDPEWDGEPVEPIKPEPRISEDGELIAKPKTTDEEGRPITPRPEKVVIKLADGKERRIQHMSATTFWSPDGKPMSASEFITKLFGDLPSLFKNEEELRHLWGQPDTRRPLLESLAEKGYGSSELGEIGRMINAQNSDIYDVLAYIAYARSPITRQERVDIRKDSILSKYDDKLKTFIDFVLAQYVKDGVEELSDSKLPSLLELKYQAITNATSELGDASRIREAFIGFQPELY